MGNASSMLTQYDIEEVQEHCNFFFSQQEIVSLYQRFCQLDRNAKGFISADEFLSVPELAMNPLSQRLLKMVDGLNFKDFVAFLSAFSARASMQQKSELIFRVYDSDCNGKVSFNDILEVLRDLSGSFLSDEQREEVRVSWVIPKGCFEHLSTNFEALGIGRKAKALWGCLVSAVFRNIWLEHNKRIFEDYTGVGVEVLWGRKVLTQVLQEAGYTRESYLTSDDFVKVLGSYGLKMEVEVPID
ncbi:uncharacterized protein LOC126611612 isoform X1 [Malus sylvestris]|uniref:uncharacterized protein LOC126611612 isoform X1 n=1 Tax=Malus sylvestris TaxID=3752 RepID=UPI0021AC8A5C|nr:uncharacterized protein LOC126611612 isoform X1 [Malus sylvestris]XP_050135882.1 uncharacterized protein LOC126611612 isoform X1 [Malus sylvestris]